MISNNIFFTRVVWREAAQPLTVYVTVISSITTPMNELLSFPWSDDKTKRGVEFRQLKV